MQQLQKKRLIYFLLLTWSFLVASEGIKYTYLEVPSSPYFDCVGGNHSIHIIEIDPSLYEIKPIKALDNGIGRETVLSISDRYGAVASVNGGFFAIGGLLDGRACGALKIHDWYAIPFKPRGCIGWRGKDQTPKMDRLLVKINAHYQLDQIPLSGLNRERKAGEIILFTPSFHRTTLTKPDGEELVIVNGVIKEIVQNGSSKIPENGYIVSIQKESPFFRYFEKGEFFEVFTVIEPLEEITSVNDWELCDYIVGGTPLLVVDRVRRSNFECEQTIPTFLTKRHSRTAVGVLPNGNWLFVVVDKTSILDGMTMCELSDLMLELGCVHALNLDGGGSSTMTFKGEIVNSPHGDEDEGLEKKMVRRVSDAIVIIPK